MGMTGRSVCGGDELGGDFVVDRAFVRRMKAGQRKRPFILPHREGY